MAFAPSTISNNDDALNDLAHKLTSLQKQQDNMNKQIDGIAVNKAAIQELQKKTKDIVGKDDMEKFGN
jgi:predicted  nucleic acid-binding Zn-ribbon protein